MRALYIWLCFLKLRLWAGYAWILKDFFDLMERVK